MKNVFADWRLPVIFAIPVLLCAGVLYMALQPMPGVAKSSTADGWTIKENATPLPTFVRSPYPTAAPLGVAPAYVLPCSSGVTQMRATVSVQSGNLVIKVTDQRGRPVVCAWLVPAHASGNSYGLGGETDANGTATYALSSLPAHFHSVSSVQFDNATTAFDYSR